MPTKIKELPKQEELAELFYYADGKLFWKERSISKGRKSAKAHREVSSCTDSNGYLRIVLNKKTYPLSRIIYQLVYGGLDSNYVIDHINRNKTDNRPENLRAIPHEYNVRKRGKHINNTSGETGVALNTKKCLLKDGTTSDVDYYVARWYDHQGILRGKHFRIDKYGEEESFRLACEHRKAMIKSLIEQGEWYDPTHGT